MFMNEIRISFDSRKHHRRHLDGDPKVLETNSKHLEEDSKVI